MLASADRRLWTKPSDFGLWICSAAKGGFGEFMCGSPVETAADGDIRAPGRMEVRCCCSQERSWIWTWLRLVLRTQSRAEAEGLQNHCLLLGWWKSFESNNWRP